MKQGLLFISYGVGRKFNGVIIADLKRLHSDVEKKKNPVLYEMVLRIKCNFSASLPKAEVAVD